MNEKLAISFENVSKSYSGHLALNGLSFEVPTGSITGLIGPNGAGKTTALAIIAGLVKVDSGLINIFGDGPFQSLLHKGRLTLLPQDAHFSPHARVSDLMIYFARLQGLSKRDAISETDTILEWVRLSDRKKKKVSTLSHGMFRRLTIAQAFLGQPELILLDEPMSGLDPEQVVSIRKLIAQKKPEQTIVISSHILTELEAVCDYVIFINQGKTILQDSLDAVINREKIVLYYLEGPEPPLEVIQELLPHSSIDFSDTRQILTIRFHKSDFSLSQINSMILPLLMNSGIGIREIRAGLSLEQEFLKYLG